jgi:hypothetical protein
MLLCFLDKIVLLSRPCLSLKKYTLFVSNKNLDHVFVIRTRENSEQGASRRKLALRTQEWIGRHIGRGRWEDTPREGARVYDAVEVARGQGALEIRQAPPLSVRMAIPVT